eukprot:TRINITY_DN42292_c0_g1_i1.p1 TRINITY_DN42292_c0_g1~~TRINITY_DN42292_c0_g1_i1.p1  ORF type:complete len:219 (-),score=41.23 TRINITY_DN42292_c0_g1_i1:177-833(-)
MGRGPTIDEIVQYGCTLIEAAIDECIDELRQEVSRPVAPRPAVPRPRAARPTPARAHAQQQDRKVQNGRADKVATQPRGEDSARSEAKLVASPAEAEETTAVVNGVRGIASLKQQLRAAGEAAAASIEETDVVASVSAQAPGDERIRNSAAGLVHPAALVAASRSSPEAASASPVAAASKPAETISDALAGVQLPAGVRPTYTRPTASVLHKTDLRTL